MNYFAHIHLAHNTKTSLLGNFLGDFVKGSDLSHLPTDIQKGIRLHRSIDSFTDRHPIIISLRQTFPDSLRRMSGVVIDLYFDHLLIRDLEQSNRKELEQVLAKFYEQLLLFQLDIGGRFPLVKENLIQHKWMYKYRHKETVFEAFQHIEKRLNYRLSFAKSAVDFLNINDHQMELAFAQFYPQLMTHCKALTRAE